LVWFKTKGKIDGLPEVYDTKKKVRTESNKA